MVDNNAQKHLNEKYPNKEAKEEEKEINLTQILYDKDKDEFKYTESGDLEIKGFKNLEKIKISTVKGEYVKFAKVTKIIIDNCPNLEKVDINTFVDNEELTITDCPKLTKLDCSWNHLTKLDLNGLNDGQDNKLEILDCNSNQLTSLDVSKCSNLTELYCHNNRLIDITLPGKKEKLKVLALLNNDFGEDFSFLKDYTKLEKLYLGNLTNHEDEFFRHYDEEKDKTKIYNRFSGSLKDLEKLSKLEILDISNTDIGINDNLEDLFKNSLNSLEEIYCSSNKDEIKNGSEWKVKKIEDKLKEKKSSFIFLSNRFIKKRSAQRWLDKKYPESGCKNKYDLKNYDKNTRKGKARSEITELNISEWGLIGTLDLSDFTKLKKLICSNNQISSLILSENKELTELDCSRNDLKTIDLNNNNQLTRLNTSDNQLTRIDLGNFSDLTELNVNNNKFSNTKFLETLINKDKLKILKLGGNEYKEEKNMRRQYKKESLDFLKSFIELTELDINEAIKDQEAGESNCFFSGNLKPLRKLTKLEIINISGTDINGGLEYLPDSCQKLYCDPKSKKNSAKIAEVFSNKYDVSENCYDIAEWRKDKANLLKRSSDVQKDIKKFFNEWKKERRELKDPRQLESYGRLFYYTKWAGRGVSVAGGILSFTHYPEIGGGIAITYPLVEAAISEWEENLYESNEKKWSEFIKDIKRLWNHYQELVDVSEPFEFYNDNSLERKLWNKVKELKEGLKKYKSEKVKKESNYRIYDIVSGWLKGGNTDQNDGDLVATKGDFAQDLWEKWDNKDSEKGRKEQWEKIGKDLIKINNKREAIEEEDNEGWISTISINKETISNVGNVVESMKDYISIPTSFPSKLWGKSNEDASNSSSSTIINIEDNERTPLLKNQIEQPPKGNK